MFRRCYLPKKLGSSKIVISHPKEVQREQIVKDLVIKIKINNNLELKYLQYLLSKILIVVFLI